MPSERKVAIVTGATGVQVFLISADRGVFGPPLHRQRQTHMHVQFRMHAIPILFGDSFSCVLQGRVLVRKLTADEGWTKVYAVSRRSLDFEHERLQHIALDLEDKDKVTKSLKSENVSGVTHVFHTAFAGDMTNTDRGVAYMLDHLIDGLEANGESLQHVYFSTGLKYYGEQQCLYREKLVLLASLCIYCCCICLSQDSAVHLQLQHNV